MEIGLIDFDLGNLYILLSAYQLSSHTNPTFLQHTSHNKLSHVKTTSVSIFSVALNKMYTGYINICLM